MELTRRELLRGRLSLPPQPEVAMQDPKPARAPAPLSAEEPDAESPPPWKVRDAR